MATTGCAKIASALKRDACLGRDAPPMPIVVTRAKGPYIYSGSRRWIDLTSGWCVNAIGWNNEEILRRLRAFNGPNYVNPHSIYEPWSELARLLCSITPGRFEKCFRATGGTEAVEIALQAAAAHTRRSQFLAIEGAYHGHSIAALSLVSKKMLCALPGCQQFSKPLNEDTAQRVERLLSSERFAALIAEPIVLNLGVEIPTKEFWEIVAEACRRYGTLLIADEVATGFGRTGELFACNHYGLRPDIMTLGKGLTSGYGALGATLMSEEVANSLTSTFGTYSTFGWLPMGVEGALSNIRYILRRKLWRHAAEMGEFFKQRLSSMQFRCGFEIRAKGLAIAIALEKSSYASQIAQRCFEAGLLIGGGGGTLLLFPPLTIQRGVAQRALELLESCL